MVGGGGASRAGVGLSQSTGRGRERACLDGVPALSAHARSSPAPDAKATMESPSSQRFRLAVGGVADLFRLGSATGRDADGRRTRGTGTGPGGTTSGDGDGGGRRTAGESCGSTSVGGRADGVECSGGGAPTKLARREGGATGAGSSGDREAN